MKKREVRFLRVFVQACSLPSTLVGGVLEDYVRFCPRFARDIAKLYFFHISKYFRKKGRRRASRCVLLWAARFLQTPSYQSARCCCLVCLMSDVVQIIFHVSKQRWEKHINTSGVRSKLTFTPYLWVESVHHSQSGNLFSQALQSTKL